jgi:hypothetical protein
MANLETATAADAVRSEAPTGILSERDSDKTASRQLATSLLCHLGTSPDDKRGRVPTVRSLKLLGNLPGPPPVVSLTDCSTKQSRATQKTRRVAQIQLWSIIKWLST